MRLRHLPLLLSLSASPALAQRGDGHAEGPASNDKFTKDDVDVARWAGRFERETREVFAHRAELVKAMALTPGVTVVDIGAGTGGLLDVLVDAVGPKGAVVATELSGRFRAHLKAKAARQGWSRVRVQESFTDRTGLADASADAILMCDVYHHLEQPAVFVKDMARALKPGGVLNIVDFDPGKAGATDWVKGHVHMTIEEVRAQVLGTGLFEALPDPTLALEQNHMLRFRRKP